MARVRKNFSLDAETIAAIDAEAARTGSTASQALEAIVARDAKGLRSGEAPAPHGNGEQLVERVSDLRDEVASLRAQLGEKDRQISELATIARQAQAVSMGAVKALGPGEQDHAAGGPDDEKGTQIVRTPDERGVHSMDTPGDDAGKRTPLRVRLGRWLAGEDRA